MSSTDDRTLSDAPDDESVDETPELDPATFDLDAWIDGAKPVVRAVTLYQRPDLLGVIDALQRDLRVAELVPDEDRGMNDPTPEGVRQKIEEAAHQFEASALVFRVEGRSDEARERIEKRLKKQDVKDTTSITLHQLADAIIEPKGVTASFLRKLQDTSESQVRMLLVAAGMANHEPPKVDVPFSSASSRSRKREARS